MAQTLEELAPKYAQITSAIRQAIADGRWKPGEQLPTESELLEQHHVSRITVIHALRLLEAEGIIVRRQGKGSFVTGRARTTREIGVIFFNIFDLTHPFLTRLLTGIEAGFDRQPGYRTHLFPIKTGIDDHETLLTRAISKGELYGLLVVSPIRQKDMEFLKRSGNRVVTVGIQYRHPLFPAVLMDHAKLSALATRHLLNRGHRRIGIIIGNRANREVFPGGLRAFQGYRAALAARHIPFDATLVREVSASEDTAYREARALFELPSRPEALVVTSPFVLGEALRALNDLNLHYPADIDIVAGVDRPEHFPFPTIQRPVIEMGRMAADMLKHPAEYPDNRPVMLSDLKLTINNPKTTFTRPQDASQ